MTDTNSCYCILSQQQKCRHFYAPSMTFHLLFLSLQCTHLSTLSKILTCVILSDIMIKANKETILQLGANMRVFLLATGSFQIYQPQLLTLNITPSPVRVSVITGVNFITLCSIANLFYFLLCILFNHFYLLACLCLLSLIVVPIKSCYSPVTLNPPSLPMKKVERNNSKKAENVSSLKPPLPSAPTNGSVPVTTSSVEESVCSQKTLQELAELNAKLQASLRQQVSPHQQMPEYPVFY